MTKEELELDDKIMKTIRFISHVVLWTLLITSLWWGGRSK